MEGNEDEVRTLLEVSESQINLLDKGGDEAELLQKENIDNQALNKKERISSSVSKSNFDEKSQTQNPPTTYTKTGENVPHHLQQSTFESASEIEKRNLSSETNLKPVTGENKFDTPSSCLEGNQNSTKCQKLNYSLVTQEQGWNDSLISQNGIRNTENASTEKLQETVGPRNDMVKTSGVEDKSNPEYLDEENPQEKLEMFGNNKGTEKSSTVRNIESKRAGKLGNSAINVSTFSGIENANNRSSTETNVLKSTVEPIVKMKCNNQDQAILADNGKDQRDTNTSRSQLHVEQLGEGDNQISENEENNESSDPDESSGNEEKGESKMENNATNVGKGDSSAKKKYHHERSNQSKKKKKKRKRKGRKRRNERKSSNVDNLVKSDEAEKVFGKNQVTSTSNSAANAHHNLTFANPLLPLPGVIQEEQDNGNTKKNHYTPPTTRFKCQNLGYQHQFPFNEESGVMELLNLEPFEPEKSIEVTFFVAAPREMEDNRIAIFFGSSKLGEWKKIGVMMDPLKEISDDYVLLMGKIDLPKKYLESKVGYKYVALEKRRNVIVFWEILYTASSSIDTERNRLLDIETSILISNSSYVQVDDLIQPPEKIKEHSKSLLEKIKSTAAKVVGYISGMAFESQMQHQFHDLMPKLICFYVKHQTSFNSHLYKKIIFMRAVHKGFFQSKTRNKGQVKDWKKLAENRVVCIKIYRSNVYYQVKVNDKIQHDVKRKFHERYLAILSSLAIFGYIHLLLDDCQEEMVIQLFRSLSLEDIITHENAEEFMAFVNNHLHEKAKLLVLDGMRKVLVEIVRRSAIISYNEVWYHPLVWLHILTGRELYKQQSEVIEKVDALTCGWDCLSEYFLLQNVRRTFIDETFKSLKSIKNTLQIDKLLQRSIAYLMKDCHFPVAAASGLFEERLLMNMMIRFMNCYHPSQELDNSLLHISEAVQILGKQLETREECDYVLKAHVIHLLLQLLLASSEKIYIVAKNGDYYNTITSVFVNLYSNTFTMNDDNPEILAKLCRKLNDLLPKIGESVKQSLLGGSNWAHVCKGNVKLELKIIQNLLKINFDGLESCGCFKKVMMGLLYKKIEQLYHLGNHSVIKFFEVYSELAEDYFVEEIQEAFHYICSTLLETFMEDPVSVKFIDSLYSQPGCGKIFRTFFKEIWEKNKTILDQLHHCLVWPPMTSFLNCFITSPHVFDDSFKDIVSEIVDLIQSTFYQLNDGTILVESLELLDERSSKFFEITRMLLQNGKLNSEENIPDILMSRVVEFKSFSDTKIALEYFLEIWMTCLPQYLDDLEELEKKIAENHSDKQLVEICNNEDDSFSYFGISRDFDHWIKRIKDCNLLASEFFKAALKKEATTVKRNSEKNSLDSLQIADCILSTTVKMLTKHVSDLLNGNIKTEVVIKLFKNIDLASQELELTTLWKFLQLDEFSKEDITLCSNKVQCVFQLEKCVGMVDDILQVADNLKLNGNFLNVELIKRKVTYKDDVSLEEIEVDLVQDTDKLLKITPNMREVLKAVSKCLVILTWLRENLQDPKEVKVFVEMMSIAAGEHDYEVDRVAFFEASCLAFSPIIFELNNESGFAEVYNACEKTAESLTEDPKIIYKLIDTNRHMEWFRQAKDSQGSVATKSLMQAKVANRNGCYIVGNIKQECQRFINEEATLEEVIELRTSEQNKDGGKVEKSYSLTEIHDLQSRLMLLGVDKVTTGTKTAENKQIEKDYFVQSSEVATQLARVYVALCEAGDTRMLQYRKEIHCNITKVKGIGLAECFDDIKDEIQQLNKQLEEWKEELQSYREHHVVMNYFTVKQCLVLQKHLYQLHQDYRKVVELHPQVFSLLKALCPDINEEKIKNAFTRSFRNNSKETTDDWQKLTSEQISNFNQFSFGQLSKFLDSLTKHDIDENVALASLLKVIPFDESEAIIWCLKQDPVDDMIEEMAEEVKEKLEKLKLDDKSAMESKNEERNEIPFLPLHRLAAFLESLPSDRYTSRREYSIPDFLNQNKPSLLILPKEDILYTVVDLYVEVGYLPMPEEVLLCSEDVSVEQIELLILRAMHNSSGIYSLVFGDSLSYEKSEQVFRFLQKSMKICTMKRPFVVFCSSKNESRSFLISALDIYRIKAPICTNKKRTCEALWEHLCMAPQIKEKGDMIYAAEVDTYNYNARVVSSVNGGMGKSLFVKEKAYSLKQILMSSAIMKGRMSRSRNPSANAVTIPVHGTSVCVNEIVESLLRFEERDEYNFPRIYHFDVAPSVSKGLDCLLFNLIILGYCQTRHGKIWRRSTTDLCIIENTKQKYRCVKSKSIEQVMLNLLPTVNCISPEETYRILQTGSQDQKKEVYFNKTEFKKEQMQRVYQYLKVFQNSPHMMNNFTFISNTVEDNFADCIKILIKYCGVSRPSWMELRNFIYFFNQQLVDSEASAFTSPAMNQDLRGFKGFVIKFLLEMAKDFATRSVNPGAIEDNEQIDQNGLLVQLKRHWEQSFHPYLFFNQDHVTLTFLGFNVDSRGNLYDPDTKKIIQCGIMTRDLYQDLNRQMERDYMTLNTNYNRLKRRQKLEMLRRVMGVGGTHDPDPTYELTIDNMKKILAIHMRLRCGIPVILMGETGCGKTRLIKFMCELRAGHKEVRNMLLVKVHGGVTAKDIARKVYEALKLAAQNKSENNQSTILFLDEANTTEGIGLIKEIMIDKHVYGKQQTFEQNGLEMIAACNPYRRHTESMISKLESAGLGYHVNVASTYEKIGHIPLRQLVYRVHPLPESMKPLMWDFGQLNETTEQAYAKQIILRYVRNEQLPSYEEFVALVVKVLAASQWYMRQRKDECSFVSLRDVERAVQVTSWFHKKMDLIMPLLDDEEENEEQPDVIGNDFRERQRRALVLALGVCYIARLEKRENYIEFISDYFDGAFALDGPGQIKQEIRRCQLAFMRELDLEENIALNHALCENVFMMVICIELRIPLFVVGKPGSSKSLAKTIVQDNMQGNLSKSSLFKNFKQILMASYQCSPLSTAEGIIGTFKQCSRFQEEKNLDQFTSVVVLDEVGLAEDSPRMPLKALHPLLEDGTDGSEELTLEGEKLKSKRVAFIGISNWSLDPAKMNRGIMLCRGQPNLEELVRTASEICNCSKIIKGKILKLLRPLAKSYLEVYERQKKSVKLKQHKKEEFFGLRDFYSLIKMVFCFSRKRNGEPTLEDIEHAVRRNFSGLDELDPWESFEIRMKKLTEKTEEGSGVSAEDMLKASFERNCPCYESREYKGKMHCANVRYLLIMTEEYSALPIIEEMYLKGRDDVNVIFGSSFPKDLEFAQICRDINRIKLCMEMGRTVVLLNMESLYESLYDALNQYYVYLGGQSYVDLGLGTHRVKCRVHEDFKLIVIADKDTVYKSFPIPLINRLEKHYIVTATCIQEKDQIMVERLKQWAREFANLPYTRKIFQEKDAFVGFNDDTCASIVIQLLQTNLNYSPEQIFKEGKRRLLQLATPDALARVHHSKLHKEAEEYWEIYFSQQNHSSLNMFLKDFFQNEDADNYNFLQVTTFSRLLSPDEKENLHLNGIAVEMMSLMQFQTEQTFRDALKGFFTQAEQPSLLIIQCGNAVEQNDLVACAQHVCKESRSEYWKNLCPVHVLFLLQLNHIHGEGFKALSGLQTSWKCIHIDELREPSEKFPSLIHYLGNPISAMFHLKSYAAENRNSSLERNLCKLEHDENLIDMEGVSIEQMNGEAEGYQKARKVRRNVEDALPIVRGCIQAAMRELSEIKNMTTNEVGLKIKILFHVLEGGMETNFLQSLFKLIHKLFLYEEHHSITGDPSNWIQDEAVQQRHLQDYGTFREALIRCVEDRLTSILSKVLVQADVNNNLMLLKDTKYGDLWVKLFGTVVGDFQEATLIDGEKKNIKGLKFPFSQQVSKMVLNAIKEQVNCDDTVQNLGRINRTINTLIFGDIVLQCNRDFVRDYVNDLVHLMFDCPTESTYEVLMREVLIGAEQILEVSKDPGNKLRKENCDYMEQENQEQVHFVVNLPMINVAVMVFEERLRNFITISNIKPDIANDLLEYNKETEVVADVLSMRKLLERLMPSENMLVEQQAQLIWTREVKEVRAMVKNVIQSQRNMKRLFGAKSEKIIKNTSLLWTRLRVLQMYIDNVSLPGVPANQSEQERIHLLGTVVQDLPDEMRTIESWNLIEDFIKQALQEEDFYCNRKLEVNAPQVPRLERRYLAFFVELVTEFCFVRDDSQKIDPNMMERIMGYAFHSKGNKTKEFSPADDFAIDPSPVVRSFILQQLLKRDEKIIKFIEECLETNLNLAQSDRDKWNICKLFIHCYEDHKTAEASILKSHGSITYHYAHLISSHLESMRTYFAVHPGPTKVTVELLEKVALARLGLVGASHLLCAKYQEECKDEDKKLDLKRREVFAHLIEIFDGNRNTDAHMFILRHIIRSCGNRGLRTVIEESQFKWLQLDLNNDNNTRTIDPDFYLVYGEVYKNLREQLAELLMQKADIAEFEDLLGVVGEQSVNQEYLSLIVMRLHNIGKELLLSARNIPQVQNVIAEVAELDCLTEDQNLRELLYHLMLVLRKCNMGLMEMYASLMLIPQRLQEQYLPTMPSDNYDEIVNAKAADGSGFIPYRCPQGHVYVITECGKPVQAYHCNECGSRIGGQSYKLEEGNAESTNRDITHQGHSLGQATERPQYAVPERRLSPLSVSLQRILTHLSMLLGVKEGHQQEISNLITPPVNVSDVSQFLLEHIQLDLRILRKVFGKSGDEINVIIHLFLKHIASISRPGSNRSYSLATKGDRDQFEEQFQQCVIEPFLRILRVELEETQKYMLNDSRIASNRHLRRLYELDPEVTPDFGDVTCMACPPFWEYRQPVTLENFKLFVQEKTVMNEGGSLQLLTLFLEQEWLLVLIKDLPTILELLKNLFGKFNYKLDMQEAKELTIGEAIKKFDSGKESQRKLKGLISKVFSLWKKLFPHLKDHGRVKVDRNFHQKVLKLTDPLAYVLPSRHGPGRCMLALIDLLAFNHNNFIRKCSRNLNLRHVPLVNIRESDLISYNPDRDLLPLVYAHCDYTLTIGRETKVEYNMQAIQKHLVEKLTLGKAEIIMQIEEFVYTDEVKHSKKYLKLQSSIKQTAIPYPDQRKMMRELRQIADVSNALRAVEISVGFLVSMKAEPNMFYKKYLTEILQMDPNVYIPSVKMQNMLRLTHLVSTWIMLQVEKAKRRYYSNEEPFIDIIDLFKAPITEALQKLLQNYFRHVDTENLLASLTEYIVSELPRRTENDVDFSVAESLELFEEKERDNPVPKEITLAHIWNLWKLVADDVRAEE